jgi:hypothetical protein
MKNQYFADRNDYFKYDLLIFLAEQLTVQRLSVVWMLTENDGSNDGGKTEYVRGAGDSRLFRFLRNSLDTGVRNVDRINEYFKDTDYGFAYCSYGEAETFRHSDRNSYFEHIPKENLTAAVVFLDPDNGLDGRSAGAGDGAKYVTYSELTSIFERMDESAVLTVYQHLPRVHRKLFLYGTFNALRDELHCPMPVAISDNRIAFIIISKTKQRQSEVGTALREYTRSHLEIFD